MGRDGEPVAPTSIQDDQTFQRQTNRFTAVATGILPMSAAAPGGPILVYQSTFTVDHLPADYSGIIVELIADSVVPAIDLGRLRVDLGGCAKLVNSTDEPDERGIFVLTATRSQHDCTRVGVRYGPSDDRTHPTMAIATFVTIYTTVFFGGEPLWDYRGAPA